MLTGILAPDEGRVEFDLPRGPGRTLAPPALGYLPEERGLSRDVPILRTLIFFGRLHGMSKADARREADAWLTRLGLADRASERIDALSKGNQQKVQFAAAVLHRPPFAILDEPFSGLDPLHQESFIGWIRELRDAGTTILLSAHQMDLVERLADRVLLIRDGREVRGGRLEDMRRPRQDAPRLRIGLSGPADLDRLEGRDDVVGVEATDDGVLVSLRDASSLGPLLADLGKSWPIRSIHTEGARLHEIYLDAVTDREDSAKGDPS